MAKDAYSRLWIYAIWTALALTAGMFVALIITYCLICQPLSAYWLSYDVNYDKSYTCINGDISSPLSGILSIISDLYAVVLPCVMLYHYDLEVARSQKIALNAIFALGTIVAGCGVARTYYFWKINHTYDTSWTGFDLFLWSLLECQLAIIFACAPSLRVFLRRYLGETLRSTVRTGSYTRTTSYARDASSDHSAWWNGSRWTNIENGKQESMFSPETSDKPGDEITSSNQQTAWNRTSMIRSPSPAAGGPNEYEPYNMRQLYKSNDAQQGVSEDQREEFEARRSVGPSLARPPPSLLTR